MKSYTYTVQLLEVVISRCDLDELMTLVDGVKKELSLYTPQEVNELVSLIGERFQYLTLANKYPELTANPATKQPDYNVGAFAHA